MINKDINQSIYDLCLQHSGSITSLFDFMKLNGLTSLQMPRFGSYVAPPVVRKNIVEEYMRRAVVPGSIDNSFYPEIYVYQIETIEFMQAIGIPEDNTLYYPGTFQQITGAALWYAVDQLVVALKDGDIWPKMRALYVFIGGNSTTHSLNLVDIETYSIEFSDTVVHDRFGISFDGTGFADTHIDFVDEPDNVHLSYFNRTNFGYGVAAGNTNGYVPDGGVLAFHDVGQCYTWVNSIGFTSTLIPTQKGLFVHTRIDPDDIGFYMRGPYNTTNSYPRPLSGTIHADTLYLGAANNSGPAHFNSSAKLSMVSAGKGFTTPEVEIFNTAVQAFHTALGRNV